MRPLTLGELNELRAISDGKTCSSHAAETWYSPHTAKWRRRELFLKLGARNAPHAVAVGFRAGLLQ